MYNCQAVVDGRPVVRLRIVSLIAGYSTLTNTSNIPENIMRAAAVIAGIILTIDLGLKTY